MNVRLPEILVTALLALGFAAVGEVFLRRASRDLVSWNESFLAGVAICAAALFPLSLGLPHGALWAELVLIALCALATIARRIRGPSAAAGWPGGDSPSIIVRAPDTSGLAAIAGGGARTAIGGGGRRGLVTWSAVAVATAEAGTWGAAVSATPGSCANAHVIHAAMSVGLARIAGVRAASSSPARICAAFWNRRCGFLASAIATHASSSRGTRGLIVDGAGGSQVVTRCRISMSSPPANSGRAVNSSHATTPTANRSQRASATPCSISGAMYANLPLSIPLIVASVAVEPLATPKSTIFAVPSSATITLAGEMSRWTRPRVRPCSSRKLWA